MNHIHFDEDCISKLPAIIMLQKLGWEYLSPAEATKLRCGNTSGVLLEVVLVSWLREHNRIGYKAGEYPFSESNIMSAVNALKDSTYEGLVRTNENIYDLLTLGKSLPQIVEGDLKSFSLHYIDWEHPERNVYHVTEEYAVARTGSNDNLRPDIVLFVNGIPLVVIECKSPAIKDAMEQAISQQIRNQKDDGIPRLFHYSQLLLALSKNEAKYATCGTSARFWAMWRENNDTAVAELKAQSLTAHETEKLLKAYGNEEKVRELIDFHVEQIVTSQDLALHALCSPERLLELTYSFVLYDAREKKIARYQQYFCVKTILSRIRETGKDGKRLGGVVWHTQGSGKSLTMVMLAKAIALCPDIPDYRIILVTDRVDLDDQIYKTFHACGKEPVQATTGKHLAKVISANKACIVTAVVNKFETAVNRYEVINTSPDVFVLVDEGHRSQFGRMNAKLKKSLPNACYIGFTGTPVMKQEKNTMAKFGGLIDSYTIDQAVKDKAVVPLLYEGRHVEQQVDKKGIDRWFEEVTAPLTKEQKNDLKMKFSTTDQLNKTDQKIKAIAWDIGIHFCQYWQGTKLKGQLVAQDKVTALKYKKYLDEFGKVSSEVLISGPDEREGETDIYAENKEVVQRFWKTVVQRFGNEKQYNKQIINAFKKSETPEIIIVVDKLLTGFDAPKNTVLYLTRKLKDHTLLQAIARVNRLYDDKDFGYIIDYRGILEGLNQALDVYAKMPEFDESDIAGLLQDVNTEAAKLPEKHSILWDTFKTIKNKADEEEYEMLLGGGALREKFYERLSGFSRTLMIALSSEAFYQEVADVKIRQYRADYNFFQKLKSAVQQRYSEIVKFSQYESKIQDLLNTYVKASPAIPITNLVNIFDKDAFEQEVQNLKSDAAKADTIAHRTKQEIALKMADDPAFYKRFSTMLEAVIKAFREERIKALEYLKQVTEIMQKVMNRTGDDIPEVLTDNDIAKAYFGILESVWGKENTDISAKLALAFDGVIEANRIVDWGLNADVQNKMRIEMEDCIYEQTNSLSNKLSYAEIDEILDKCIEIAKHRQP